MVERRRAMSLHLTACPADDSFCARPISKRDIEPLGILLYNAFHGSIDDEGETVDEAIREIERVFDGSYGTLLPDASFIIGGEERLSAACLISWFEPHQAPLVVFSMTHPDERRGGMARELLRRSIDTLFRSGESLLTLVVTPGNEPALALYRSLGFADWPGPVTQ